MIGGIIGDVIGSRFELNNIKTKEFDLFTEESTFTDDTVLTVAIAECVLNNNEDYATTVKQYANNYPSAGYGGTFLQWMTGTISGPYNSWGNGSAMRVSSIGFAFDTEETVLEEARKSAEITHNHPEGIKGAQAIAMAIWLARTGNSKEAIQTYMEQQFGYDLHRNINTIRQSYTFDVSCQGSVPEAILCFLESTDFEDAIRTAISIGGDSDTIACMVGAIAQAYYKDIPNHLITQTKATLTDDLLEVVEHFEVKYSLND